jgi:hypothetical protein
LAQVVQAVFIQELQQQQVVQTQHLLLCLHLVVVLEQERVLLETVVLVVELFTTALLAQVTLVHIHQ